MSPSSFSKWRIKILLGFFALFAFAILSFLFRWQVLEKERFEALAEQRVQSSDMTSIRGPILAGDGSPLAYSVPVYDVYIAIWEVEDAERYETQSREQFVTSVAPILKIKDEKLREVLGVGGYNYVLTAKEISVDQKDALGEILIPNGNLQGIHFESKEKRIYPDGELASHVLGFVGRTDEGENLGMSGVEGYWEGDLAWKRGFLYEERDVYGNQILTSDFEPIRPKVGRTVKLTINRGVQKVVEEMVDYGVKKYDAKSGSIIVMDPKTGYIIAMANYPDYNPNKYWEEKDQGVFNNKSVSFPYEYGSVGKCLTAAAGIDTGLFKADTIVFEHRDACVEIEDYEICVSDKKESGPKTVTNVLETSDNIGAYYIARKVGKEKMYEYFLKFGIGQNTNVGLAEENTAFLKTGDKWNKVDLITYSFGQGYSATPIQLLSAVSAISNYGSRMQPTIVSEVQDEDKVIKIEPRVLDNVISKKSSEITTDMLVSTFEKNGLKFYYPEVQNYRLAGKTGTAQVLAENGKDYDEDKINTSFIGYDASENRSFIMVVKLEEPQVGDYSLYNAQPLWAETFLAMKDYLGIVPVVGE